MDIPTAACCFHCEKHSDGHQHRSVALQEVAHNYPYLCSMLNARCWSQHTSADGPMHLTPPFVFHSSLHWPLTRWRHSLMIRKGASLMVVNPSALSVSVPLALSPLFALFLQKKCHVLQLCSDVRWLHGAQFATFASSKMIPCARPALLRPELPAINSPFDPTTAVWFAATLVDSGERGGRGFKPSKEVWASWQLLAARSEEGVTLCQRQREGIQHHHVPHLAAASHVLSLWHAPWGLYPACCLRFGSCCHAGRTKRSSRAFADLPKQSCFAASE